MMPLDVSCGTRIRSLFGLLCWPLSMRPSQHHRFVRIGHGCMDVVNFLLLHGSDGLRLLQIVVRKTQMQMGKHIQQACYKREFK